MKWIFLVTMLLVAVGLAAFPISIHLEKITGRYDSYSVIGFGVSIFYLFTALLILTIGTVYRVIVWNNRPGEPQELCDLQKELPDWDLEE